MGTVYQGYSCEDNMPVAIKQVKPLFAEVPSIRKRAHTEASMMFRHRNLVEMLGCCEPHPSAGPIYIISKFVFGTNLDDFIKENMSNMPAALRCTKICDLLFPVMNALEYIHSHGIVHLDIKPSNIMVENGRNVRLMDLGISNTQEALLEDIKISFIGTPKYAAPEQFGLGYGGQGANVTSDIYSLAITMYELLTGRNPFESNDLKSGIELRKRKILPYSINVPNAIVDVLRKATSFNQAERYNSISEFRNAIQDALHKKQRNWRPLIIGVISFLILIILLITIILLVL